MKHTSIILIAFMNFTLPNICKAQLPIETPFSTMDGPTLRIIFRDKDYHINQLWSTDGKNWSSTDHSPKYATPKNYPERVAKGKPFGIRDKWGTFHIFYRDFN